MKMFSRRQWGLLVALVVICAVEGKLKRLGEHSAPSKGVLILGGKFPPPGVFYNHFTNPSKPLLMKNVLAETSFPAFKMWTDEYLSEHYGDEDVDVEMGKKENRNGENANMPLSRFIKLYQDNDLYLVHDLPKTMHGDISVPYSLRCGGYQDNIVNVVMWYSSGNTSSVLHLDSLDNINCVIDGKKSLVLIDKAYKDVVEEVGWEHERGFSAMDVSAVDPVEYSGIAGLPWQQVNLEAGDCVFIPALWYHHVYTPPGRSIALNFWFSQLHWFNETDCNGIERQNQPLTDFTMASSNMETRALFLGQFAGLKFVKETQFTASVPCKDKAKELWKIFNTDGDKKLTWEELSFVNFDDLIQQYPQCFNELDLAEGMDDDDDAADDLIDTDAREEKILDDVDIDANDFKSDENLASENIDDNSEHEILNETDNLANENIKSDYVIDEDNDEDDSFDDVQDQVAKMNEHLKTMDVGSMNIDDIVQQLQMEMTKGTFDKDVVGDVGETEEDIQSDDDFDDESIDIDKTADEDKTRKKDKPMKSDKSTKDRSTKKDEL